MQSRTAAVDDVLSNISAVHFYRLTGWLYQWKLLVW